MSKHNMPELPSLPSSSSPRRLSACFCGCGGVTGSKFCPGHDATLKAWVRRVEAGRVDIAALADWPGMQKRVREVVKQRADGINPTFMGNVELPEPVKKTVRKPRQATPPTPPIEEEKAS